MNRALAAVSIGALALLLAGCGTTTPKAVPDVSGQGLDVAVDTLDRAGLRYETVGGGAFGVVVLSHWTVCSQRPAPGTSAASVTLFVSRSCPLAGENVVPDVVDQSLEDVRDVLEADGFAVSVRSVDGDPVLVEGFWTVCEQRPAPGQRGRTVVLEVAHDCWDEW